MKNQVQQAAIQLTEIGQIWTLPRPARHGDIIDALHNVIPDTWALVRRFAAYRQGFVDSRGVFLTRSEAHVLAVRSGQLSVDVWLIRGDEVLFSEDLW